MVDRSRSTAAGLVIVLLATTTVGSAQVSDAAPCCAPPATAMGPALERPAAQPTTTPKPLSPPPRPVFTKRARKKLTRDLERYLSTRSGSVSVAVTDLSSGLSYDLRGKLQAPTASTSKVAILMALLLRAQRSKRKLSAGEKTLASIMIRYSDNKAATALWHMIGGTSGMASAYRRLGLRRTTPGNGDYWGSTMTTATEQLRLLRQLISPKSPLNPASRRYVLDLMSRVSPDQAWGVRAAAKKSDSVALKNGWQPRKSDGDLYAINTIGRIRSSGHDFLVAVMSTRNSSSAAGIETVEQVAKLVVGTLRTAAHLPQTVTP